MRNKLEEIFEKTIWQSRFIVLSAVIFGLIGAIVLFIIASIDIFNVARFTITTYVNGLHPEHFHEDVVSSIIGGC